MAEKHFRCADVGYTECDWHLEGNSDEEMLPQIENHALEVHHLELKDEAIEHVKKAIHATA
jgi:predicted small metal-binding protein